MLSVGIKLLMSLKLFLECTQGELSQDKCGRCEKSGLPNIRIM